MLADSTSPTLLYAWGKARPSSAVGPRWHPLVYHAHAARWGLDQARDDTAWPASAEHAASAARHIVELAAHIVMELPDDPDAAIPQAKNAARRWLETRGR